MWTLQIPEDRKHKGKENSIKKQNKTKTQGNRRENSNPIKNKYKEEGRVQKGNVRDLEMSLRVLGGFPYGVAQTPQNHPPPSTPPRTHRRLPLACGAGGIPLRAGSVFCLALPFLSYILSCWHSSPLCCFPPFSPIFSCPAFPFSPSLSPLRRHVLSQPSASASLPAGRSNPQSSALWSAGHRSPAAPGTCPSALPASFARPGPRTLTNGSSLLCVGCCVFFLVSPQQGTGV